MVFVEEKYSSQISHSTSHNGSCDGAERVSSSGGERLKLRTNPLPIFDHHSGGATPTHQSEWSGALRNPMIAESAMLKKLQGSVRELGAVSSRAASFWGRWSELPVESEAAADLRTASSLAVGRRHDPVAINLL